MRRVANRAEIEALGAGKRVVLFHGTWCPFCRRFKPIFEESTAARGIESSEALLDPDSGPLWSEYSLQTLPTVIAFDGDKPIARLEAGLGVGIPRQDLEKMLDGL